MEVDQENIDNFGKIVENNLPKIKIKKENGS